MESLVIAHIEGMSCGGCVATVEKVVSNVPGVKKVKVSLDKKEAQVEGDGLDRSRIVRAIEDAGYDVGA